MSTDHRKEARHKVFLKGRITFNNGASSFDCLVRDMSTSGARLALSETATLPEAFDLHIPQKDRTYRAALRWRREDGIGIAVNGLEAASREAAREAARAAPAPAAEPEGSVAFLLRRVRELEAENAILRRLLADIAPPPVDAA